jgi:hypothetical protein
VKCEPHREDESAYELTEEMMAQPGNPVSRHNRIGSQTLITEEKFDGQTDFSEFDG